MIAPGPTPRRDFAFWEEGAVFHPSMRLLRCFAAIAETGSVTRAAEQLNLTQSTVSGQLKELEQNLDLTLFDRTTRSLHLTRHGRVLLPTVQEILAKTELLCRQAQELHSTTANRLRIGAAVYSLDIDERNDLLDDFARDHPAISFNIDSRLQCDLIDSLRDGRLPAALLLGISAQAVELEAKASALPQETVYPDHLERVVLGRRPLGLVMPHRHPLSAETLIPPEALAEQEIVMLSRDHGWSVVDQLRRFFTERGARLTSGSEGNALAIAREANRRGICAIGIGWFPAPPGMVFREVRDLDLHFDFALVLGKDAPGSARKLFDYARARVARTGVTRTARAG